MARIPRIVITPISASILATVTLRRAVISLSRFFIPIGCSIPRIASIVAISSNLNVVTNVRIATTHMDARTALFAIHRVIVPILSIASDVRTALAVLAFVTRRIASSMNN